jgi:hypothetical protein
MRAGKAIVSKKSESKAQPTAHNAGRRYVAIVPPRKACGKIPTCDGSGVIVGTTLGEKPREFTLNSLDDTRLFIRGIFPATWRKLDPTEEVPDGIIPLHRRYRERKRDEPYEEFSARHPSQLTYATKCGGVKVVTEILTHVADELVGVESGDVVASILGSTGGLVLAGLIHRIPEGITIKGITVFTFIGRFGDEFPEEKRAKAIASLLVLTAGEDGDVFHPILGNDLSLIKMSSALDQFTETQRARIAQGNRVFAATRASTFTDRALFMSNHSIETMAEQAIENDETHILLVGEEGRLKKVLAGLLEEIPIYVALRKRVKGAAVSILAPIIATTLYISRFPAMGKAVRYWGLGLRDGQFMRRQTGKELGFHPACRQAFYQFGMQIVKGGAEPFWCERYGLNVERYRLVHPHPVLVELLPNPKYVKNGNEKKWVDGRRFKLVQGTFEEIKEGTRVVARMVADPDHPEQRIRVEKGYFLYNPGHLYKMALWRTLTEFGEWLYWFWRSLEGLESRPPHAFPPEDGDAVEKTAEDWGKTHGFRVEKGYRPPGSTVQVADLMQAAAA